MVIIYLARQVLTAACRIFSSAGGLVPLTRDQTQAPVHWELGILTIGPPKEVPRNALDRPDVALSCPDPAQAQQLPMDYVHRVKRTHSQGAMAHRGK